MEKADTRLLEEWKANLDLLKFYETLKQQRFAHFLTIQPHFSPSLRCSRRKRLAFSRS